MNILRTKVNNNFLFVENNEELIGNIPDFINHGKYDQYGTPITAEFFSRVIRKYVFGCGSDFFIEFHYVSVEDDLNSRIAIRKVIFFGDWCERIDYYLFDDFILN